jgi:hypothetical protein
MKSRLLTRFTSWFFNTSPEWVAPEQKQIDSAGMPLQEDQQMPPPAPKQGDAVASDTSTDPSQENRR